MLVADVRARSFRGAELSAARQFYGARLANAPSKEPNSPTPPDGLRWGEGESGSTRKRIDSSPDVKGVFGEGASVVAVAPAPPTAANADAVANLFRADAPFSAPPSHQELLRNTRAKSRGLWSDVGLAANDGSAPLSPSRVGTLPRAVVGRAVTEAPPHAVALAAPLPSRPAQRTHGESLEIPASPASPPSTQRSLPAARTSLPGNRPSLPQSARNETPAMRLDLAFNSSQDLQNFNTSRGPSNQNSAERISEARARTSQEALSFQDEPTTVKSPNPAASFAEIPVDVAVEAAPQPSLKAPARPRSTTPAAARVSQQPRGLQPTAAKVSALRLPLILVCAGALAAVGGFLLAGGRPALWNSQPTAAKLPTLTVQPTLAPQPAPSAPAQPEAKPEPAPAPAAEKPDTTAQAAPEADKPAAAAEAPAPAPAPAPAIELPPDLTPEQQLVMARAELRAKHPEMAEALARAMLEHAADDHHAAEALAAALLAQGKGAAALPYAEQIVRKRPKRAPYRVLLGDVKLSAGDREGAINAFKEALKLEPTNRDAKRRLSTLE